MCMNSICLPSLFYKIGELKRTRKKAHSCGRPIASPLVILTSEDGQASRATGCGDVCAQALLQFSEAQVLVSAGGKVGWPGPVREQVLRGSG